MSEPVVSDNPFLRYRERLDCHRAALDGGLGDAWFVATVESLDSAVAEVDGTGFVVTPTESMPALAAAAGLDVDLHVKIEVDNVGGSHKARHLFGVALTMLVEEALGGPVASRLAIASCGNAALGAAIVARALDRELAVFVPTWADPAVLAALDELGADVRICERRTGETGDPCYLRFREAVAAGSRPFSVQGTDTPATLDGGRTIGWELADQVAGLDALYVQVGGGALATCASRGVGDVALFPVQAEGCAPLARAWQRLEPDFDFAAAAAEPDRYMWPWDDPHSAATGILDDVTYDWLPLLERTRETGGEPVVASESAIGRAHDLVTAAGVAASPTGTAGFAGLLGHPPPAGSRVAVLVTGVGRE